MALLQPFLLTAGALRLAWQGAAATSAEELRRRSVALGEAAQTHQRAVLLQRTHWHALQRQLDAGVRLPAGFHIQCPGSNFRRFGIWGS
jgi:hypothetical protein